MTSSETRLHSGAGTMGFEMVGDLFVNLAFEDLMVGALPGCCAGCRSVDRGRGSQEESMASRREMLIEILNYSGFIGGDSVS